MNECIIRSALGATAVAFALAQSSPASAAMVAAICDSATCLGGNSLIVTDNGAGDTIGALGAINFTTSFDGYTLNVNTSQSKPMIGSATAPQLDLNFAVTSNGSPTGSVFLFVSDTDFLTDGKFQMAMGGTNSGSSDTVGRAWGGTSNVTMDIANLFGLLAPLSGAAYSATANPTLGASVNPYSLTLGAEVTRFTSGTSTGDLNLNISAVPEPSTWAMLILGFCAIGFVGCRRKEVLRLV
jgi:hypothetical protein